MTEGAITPEGLEALKAELHELETGGRREMAARILAARELGDLKENAEYHIAKEDQAHLETKIQRLQERLRSARVVEAPSGAAPPPLRPCSSACRRAVRRSSRCRRRRSG